MKLTNYIVTGAAVILLIVIATRFDASDVLAIKLIMLAAAVAFFVTRKLRSSLTPVQTGAQGMIGAEGRAETEIAHEGLVFVRGELWRARSVIRIAPGKRVRVLELTGLLLTVEPADDQEMLAPRRFSVVDEE